MIDPTAWHWPQFTLLAMFFIATAIHAHKHGKPQEQPYSFPMAICRAALWLFVITLGGFFA